MIAQTVQTVHTAGINWASVLTIVCALVGAMGVVFGVLAKWITTSLNRTITDSINVFRISVVSELANRLTVVETKVDLLLNTKGRDKQND
jgi:hypothetical protein